MTSGSSGLGVSLRTERASSSRLCRVPRESRLGGVAHHAAVVVIVVVVTVRNSEAGKQRRRGERGLVGAEASNASWSRSKQMM
ncbi:hypothetical protein N658DRAFT_71580 [Parathielavia hyrcaniae]|uniref:Uncharacterized protein n=1 Tax=Parathielavia hyrcaniae TaxID=113614 RepID=A0AAN6Q0H4_9PEZI|nr:hypothetical protein N658DRAFT_71580 [Parathielavia hyrcaniae]